MKDEKIINGNCWVAYFDILGFKNETHLNKGQLPVLAYMYSEVAKLINTMNEELKEVGAQYDCLWFSDSFLFYSFDDSINSYNLINFAARQLFDYMINTKKWPLRGALTVGDFYADKNRNIYLGEALIDAINFTEKQDWIGWVLTPNAPAKLVASGYKLFTWVDGLCFREYDVPIKRRISNNGSEQIVLDYEKLWAYHFRTTDHKRNMFMASLQSICKKGNGLSAGQRRKYENTLRFYEKPCQCSVCGRDVK